ncbi:MAG: PD40 domain-containing protein [Bacteroidetes bacterium]|nr:PD40 domain-containing protein [Bacteroidota bacterium]
MNKLTFIFLFLSVLGFAQKKEKKGNAVGDAAKMAIAKQKLYAFDYVGALNTYREVEQNNSNDAPLKYYVGLCYFNLKQYENAKQKLLTAVDINKDLKPETHLVLAKIYQIDEEFDKAIDAATKFKSFKNVEQEDLEDAELLTKQCTNAKMMIENPVNVNVMNMGAGINSAYDDKNPCITADGQKLVFTTRRPESTSALTDVQGDGKYFENIYIADYDTTSHKFANAASVGKPVNTLAHDACTSISPDGKQIFIYQNDINNKESIGGNVFVSKVQGDGKWKKPESLGKPVNSTYWEGGVCISPDGKKYFFSSERPGGYGRSDIWVVERKKKEWGKPVNLGAEINTPYDEAGMFLAPDGKTLFFCSNGPKSMGSYDVFKTVYENGKWSTPVNVGYPINTAAKEGQLTISADARYAYVSSDRKGGLGENDIYKIDLQDYAILEKDGKRKSSNGLSIIKGIIREGGEGYGVPDVEITLTDEAGTTVVASTLTNENGEYFLTLNGGKYILNVVKKGYEKITEPVSLEIGETEVISLEKGYLLKK